MNKAELIEQVAGQTGLAKRASGKAVDAVVSAMSDCLARGEKVTLVGFGIDDYSKILFLLQLITFNLYRHLVIAGRNISRRRYFHRERLAFTRFQTRHLFGVYRRSPALWSAYLWFYIRYRTALTGI